jgi:hypothetical protein
MTRWFQPFEGEPELIIVVQRLVNLLTTSNSGLFKKVCAALLAIGSEQLSEFILPIFYNSACKQGYAYKLMLPNAGTWNCRQS